LHTLLGIKCFYNLYNITMSNYIDSTITSFVVEGLIIGICVVTINVYSGEISLYLTGKDDDRRILWTLGLIVAVIGHVLAETLRGPRIIKLFDDYSKSVSKNVSNVSKSVVTSGGTGLKKMKKVVSEKVLSSSVNNAIVFEKLKKLQN